MYPPSYLAPYPGSRVLHGALCPGPGPRPGPGRGPLPGPCAYLGSRACLRSAGCEYCPWSYGHS